MLLQNPNRETVIIIISTPDIQRHLVPKYIVFVQKGTIQLFVNIIYEKSIK